VRILYRTKKKDEFFVVRAQQHNGAT